METGAPHSHLPPGSSRFDNEKQRRKRKNTHLTETRKHIVLISRKMRGIGGADVCCRDLTSDVHHHWMKSSPAPPPPHTTHTFPSPSFFVIVLTTLIVAIAVCPQHRQRSDHAGGGGPFVEAGSVTMLDCNALLSTIPFNASSAWDSPDEYHLSNCGGATLQSQVMTATSLLTNTIIYITQSSFQEVGITGNTENVTVVVEGGAGLQTTTLLGVRMMFNLHHTNLNVTITDVQISNIANTYQPLLEAFDGTVISGALHVAARNIRGPYQSGIVRALNVVVEGSCRMNVAVDGLTDNTSDPIPTLPWLGGIYSPVVWIVNVSVRDPTVPLTVAIDIANVEVFFKESMVVLSNVTSWLSNPSMRFQNIRCSGGCSLMREQQNQLQNLTVLARDSVIRSSSTRFASTAATMLTSFLSIHIGTLYDVRNINYTTAIYRSDDTASAIQATYCSFSGVIVFMHNVSITSVHNAAQTPLVSYSANSIIISLVDMKRSPTQLNRTETTTTLGDASMWSLMLAAGDEEAALRLTEPIGVAVVTLNTTITDAGIFSSVPLALSLVSAAPLSTLGNAVLWVHQSNFRAYCDATSQLCAAVVITALNDTTCSMADLYVAITGGSQLDVSSTKGSTGISLATSRVQRATLRLADESSIALTSSEGGFMSGILCSQITELEMLNISISNNSAILVETLSSRGSTLTAVSIVASVGATYLSTATSSSSTNTSVADAMLSVRPVFHVTVHASTLSISAPNADGAVSVAVVVGNVTQLVIFDGSATAASLPWTMVLRATSIQLSDGTTCRINANRSVASTGVLVSDTLLGGYAVATANAGAWLSAVNPSNTSMVVGRAASITIDSGARVFVEPSTSIANTTVYSAGFSLDVCNLCSGPLSLVASLLQRGVAVRGVYTTAQLVVDSTILQAGTYVETHGTSCGGTIGLSASITNSTIGNGFFVNHNDAQGLCGNVSLASSLTPPPVPVPAYANYSIHYNASFLVDGITQMSAAAPIPASYNSWIFIVPQDIYRPRSVVYDNLTAVMRNVPSSAPVTQTAYALLAVVGVTLSSQTTLIVESVAVSGAVPPAVFPTFGLCGAVGLLNVVQDFSNTLSITTRHVALAGLDQVQLSRGVSVDNLVQLDGGGGVGQGQITILIDNCSWTTTAQGVRLFSIGQTLSNVFVTVKSSSMVSIGSSAVAVFGDPTTAVAVTNTNITIEATTLYATTTSAEPACIWLAAPLLQQVAVLVSHSDIGAIGTAAATAVWLNGAVINSTTVTVTNASAIRAVQGVVLSVGLQAMNNDDAAANIVQNFVITLSGNSTLELYNTDASPQLLSAPRRGVWVRGVRVLDGTVTLVDSTVWTPPPSSVPLTSMFESWRLVDVYGNITIAKRQSRLSVILRRCIVTVRHVHSESGSGLVWIGGSARLDTCDVVVDDSTVDFMLLDSGVGTEQLDGYMIGIALPPAASSASSTPANISVLVNNTNMTLSAVTSTGVLTLWVASALNAPDTIMPSTATNITLATTGGVMSLTCGTVSHDGSCHHYLIQSRIELVRSTITFTRITPAAISAPSLTSAITTLLRCLSTTLRSSLVMVADTSVSEVWHALVWQAPTITDTTVVLTGSGTSIGAVNFASSSIATVNKSSLSNVLFLALDQGAHVAVVSVADNVAITSSAFILGGFSMPTNLLLSTPTQSLMLEAIDRCSSGAMNMYTSPRQYLISTTMMDFANGVVSDTTIGWCDQRVQLLSSVNVLTFAGEAGDTLSNVTVIIRNVTMTRWMPLIVLDLNVIYAMSQLIWKNLTVVVRNVTIGSHDEAQGIQGGSSTIVFFSGIQWLGGAYSVDALLLRGPGRGDGGILYAAATAIDAVFVTMQRSVASTATVVQISAFSNFTNSTITILQSRFVCTYRLRMIELVSQTIIRNVVIVFDNTDPFPSPLLDWMNSIEFVPVSSRSALYINWTDPALSIVDRWVNVLDGTNCTNLTTLIRNVSSVVQRYGVFHKEGIFTNTSVVVQDCQIIQTNGTLVPVESSPDIVAFVITLRGLRLQFVPDMFDVSTALTVIAISASRTSLLDITVTDTDISLVPTPLTAKGSNYMAAWSVVSITYSIAMKLRIRIANATAHAGNASQSLTPANAEAPYFVVVALVSIVNSRDTLRQTSIIVTNSTLTVHNIITPVTAILLWTGNDGVDCDVVLAGVGLYVDTRPVTAASKIIPYDTGAAVVVLESPAAAAAGKFASLVRVRINVSCDLGCTVLQSRGSNPLGVAASVFVSLNRVSLSSSLLSMTTNGAATVLEGHHVAVLLMNASSAQSTLMSLTNLPNTTLRCAAKQPAVDLPRCAVLLWRTAASDALFKTVSPSQDQAPSPTMYLSGSSTLLVANVTAVATLPLSVVIGDVLVSAGASITLASLNLSATSDVSDFAASTCADASVRILAPTLSASNVLLLCSMVYFAGVSFTNNTSLTIQDISIASPAGTDRLQMLPLGMFMVRVRGSGAIVRVDRLRLMSTTTNITSAFRLIAVTLANGTNMVFSHWNLSGAGQLSAAMINESSLADASTLTLSSMEGWRGQGAEDGSSALYEIDVASVLCVQRCSLHNKSTLHLLYVDAALQHREFGGFFGRSVVFFKSLVAAGTSEVVIEGSTLRTMSSANYAATLVTAVYMDAPTLSSSVALSVTNSTLYVSALGPATSVLVAAWLLSRINVANGAYLSLSSSVLSVYSATDNAHGVWLWNNGAPLTGVHVTIRNASGTVGSCSDTSALLVLTNIAFFDGSSEVRISESVVSISGPSGSHVLLLNGTSATLGQHSVSLDHVVLRASGGGTLVVPCSAAKWGEVSAVAMPRAYLTGTSLSLVNVTVTLLVDNVTALLVPQPQLTVMPQLNLYWEGVSLLSSRGAMFTMCAFTVRSCRITTESGNATMPPLPRSFRLRSSTTAVWAVVMLNSMTLTSTSLVLSNVTSITGVLCATSSSFVAVPMRVEGGTYGGASMVTLTNGSVVKSSSSFLLHAAAVFATPMSFASSSSTSLSTLTAPTPWANSGIVLQATDGTMTQTNFTMSDLVLVGHALTNETDEELRRNWWVSTGTCAGAATNVVLRNITSSVLLPSLTVSPPGLIRAARTAQLDGWTVSVVNTPTGALGAPQGTGLVCGGNWSGASAGVTVEGSVVQVATRTGGVLIMNSSFVGGAAVRLSNSMILNEPLLQWWGPGATVTFPSLESSKRPLRIYCSVTSSGPVRRIKNMLPHLYFISPYSLTNGSAACDGYLPPSISVTASSSRSASSTNVATTTFTRSVTTSLTHRTVSEPVTPSLCSSLVVGQVLPSTTPSLYDVFIGAVYNFTMEWSSPDGAVPMRVADVTVRSSWGTILPSSVLVYPSTYDDQDDLRGSNVGALQIVVVAVPIVASFLATVDVTIEVDVLAYCSRPTTRLSLQRTVLPVPEPARTTGQAAAVVGVVGAAAGVLSVGGAIQRSMLLLQLSVCEFSLASEVSISDSPTRMGFGDEENYFIRGTVVGNLLLMIAFVALTVIVAEVLHRRETSSSALIPWNAAVFLQAWGKHTRMPGVFLAPLSILLQPMVSNSISLVAYPIASYDIALGIIGLVIMVGLAVLLLLHGMHKIHFLSAYRHSAGNAVLSSLSSPPVSWIVATNSSRRRASLAEWLLKPMSGWVPHRNKKSDGRKFLHQFGHVFEEFREAQRWFAGCDLLMSFACGVIAALKPTTPDGCTALTLTLLVLTALYAFLIAVLRPCNVAIGNLNSFVNAAANVICAAMIVSGFDDVSDVLSLAMTALNVLLSLTGVIAVAFQLGILRFTGDGDEDKRQRGLRRAPQKEDAAATEVPILMMATPPEATHSDDDVNLQELPKEMLRAATSVIANVKGYVQRPASRVDLGTAVGHGRRDADGKLVMGAFLSPLEDILGSTAVTRDAQPRGEALQLLLKCKGVPRSAAEQRRRLQVAIIAAVCSSSSSSSPK